MVFDSIGSVAMVSASDTGYPVGAKVPSIEVRGGSRCMEAVDMPSNIGMSYVELAKMAVRHSKSNLYSECSVGNGLRKSAMKLKMKSKTST